MSSAKRCAMGCQSWPNSAAYNTCPICGEETRYISREPTVTVEEAQSIKRHIDFEAFYANHCATLGIPIHGPLKALEVVD